MEEEQYVNEFIGWKLEDISEILSSISGIEIPEDPNSDWSEPTNGSLLSVYLLKNHDVQLGWSFAVPNSRSHGGPFGGELGTLLVGVSVNLNSIDSTKLETIHRFHEKLRTKNENVSNPMYVGVDDEGCPTAIAPWWS